MEAYLTFAQSHLGLFAAFFGLILIGLLNELRIRRSARYSVSPSRLVQMLNKEKAQLIDIRPETTFNDSHILGAQHIDKASAWDWIERHQAPNRPIVVVCDAGSESVKLAHNAHAKGFTVFCLENGLASWKEANYPLQSKS